MSDINKKKAFLVFISVVVVIYLALNIPLYLQGKALLKDHHEWMNVYLIVFLVFSSSYIVARLGQSVFPALIKRFLLHLGSFWLAAILYFYVMMLFVFLFKSFIHLINPDLYKIINDSGEIVLMGSVGVVSLVLMIGYINARMIKTMEYAIRIPKTPSGREKLTVAVVSDIHAGHIIGKRFLSRLVRKINELKVDLILIAGDLIDEDVSIVEKEEMGKIFSQLQAPMGVFAITGNHEYIGNAEKAISYFTSHNISFLRDETILIDNSFYLTGREDRDKARFTGTNRLTADALAHPLDKSRPMIILDHQPAEIQSVEKAGFDLCISGHTHHGQLWPLNYITASVYKISRGYQKIGNTHFVVSNGAGTWGPPVRIGNRPEIIRITIDFS